MQDEEKRKLSRDLHDSTGQTLTALKISIALLQDQCKEDPAMLLLASDAAELADQTKWGQTDKMGTDGTDPILRT